MVGSKNSIAQAIPLVLSGRSAMPAAARHGRLRENQQARRAFLPRTIAPTRKRVEPMVLLSSLLCGL